MIIKIHGYLWLYKYLGGPQNSVDSEGNATKTIVCVVIVSIPSVQTDNATSEMFVEYRA